MCLPKIWQASIRPFKFTVMMWSNSSSGMSKNGVGEFTPAPFTKMSTRLNLASTSASSFCRPVLDVVSHGKNSALPPSLAILSSRFCALAASRPTSATVAPAAARPSAISPHNSPVPPMTTATLPLSENSSAGVFINISEVPAPALAHLMGEGGHRPVRVQALSLHPRAAAAHRLFHFLARGHAGVAGRGRGQRAVRRAVIHGLLRVVEFEKTEMQAAGKTVAAADAVQNFQIRIFLGSRKIFRRARESRSSRSSSR